MPPGLDVTYFVNSGSEANDLAITMARLYTGNSDVDRAAQRVPRRQPERDGADVAQHVEVSRSAATATCITR